MVVERLIRGINMWSVLQEQSSQDPNRPAPHVAVLIVANSSNERQQGCYFPSHSEKGGEFHCLTKGLTQLYLVPFFQGYRMTVLLVMLVQHLKKQSTTLGSYCPSIYQSIWLSCCLGIVKI